MSLRQFFTSIRGIARNPYVPVHVGVGKHVLWQLRKVLNLFPFEQQFSQSRIIATRHSGVSALINSQGLYDPNNMRLLREILDDSERVFFDIGANIGSYTLLASEQPARIFAFEPHPVTFQLLEKNVKRNGRSNVKLYRLALGSENRDSFLTDYRENCINRIVKSSEKYSIKICCMRGDSLIRDTGVIPEIVKIDTEGHEHEVLNGMGDYLVQVDLLFVEITKHRDAVLEILLENGLRGPYSLAFSRKVFFPASGEPQEDEVFLSDREICRLSKKGYRFQ